MGLALETSLLTWLNVDIESSLVHGELQNMTRGVKPWAARSGPQPVVKFLHLLNLDGLQLDRCLESIEMMVAVPDWMILQPEPRGERRI